MRNQAAHPCSTRPIACSRRPVACSTRPICGPSVQQAPDLAGSISDFQERQGRRWRAALTAAAKAHEKKQPRKEGK